MKDTYSAQPPSGLLVMWDVYVTRANNEREWLGSVLAPVCINLTPRDMTQHAVLEARRQFMSVLRDDDPEPVPMGTTLQHLEASLRAQGITAWS